ncbi:MAG TPA: crossover junction endodeoxyribonuclease RuvC [Candidatus Paceibacterota bacterium]|nr:crossover junction endodeoxyribonuclease RuvC [Candidatus Paceibacterota bacterium]
MIILGIDPGTTIIGYGVIRNENNTFSKIAYGTIRNPGKDKPTDLKNTAQELTKLIKKYQPEILAVEKLFFINNQKTALAVSEMRGIILLTGANFDLPVYEFTPLQVKQFVSGYGGAEKKQIQKMVRLILKIKEEIRPDDAADALAIALCCAASHRPS